MRDIRMFISDIDGVWTDGGMYYDNTGNEWKKFNTSDSAGVLFLKLLGIPLSIITGEDTEIVRRRMQKLGVPGLHMGVKDKVGVAESICREAGISLSQVAYIGDDLNDIALLRSVGLSAVPLNAPAYIKDIAQWVIPVSGGDGAFRAFVEKYLAEEGLLQKALDAYHAHASGFRQ